ncbi:hypothetical protein DFQ26_005094 [Actinomortierella ambigua]|nr:hypothetical protein DFQ26_005094 [Actinomortierella ambigua]
MSGQLHFVTPTNRWIGSIPLSTLDPLTLEPLSSYLRPGPGTEGADALLNDKDFLNRTNNVSASTMHAHWPSYNKQYYRRRTHRRHAHRSLNCSAAARSRRPVTASHICSSSAPAPAQHWLSPTSRSAPHDARHHDQDGHENNEALQDRRQSSVTRLSLDDTNDDPAVVAGTAATEVPRIGSETDRIGHDAVMITIDLHDENEDDDDPQRLLRNILHRPMRGGQGEVAGDEEDGDGDDEDEEGYNRQPRRHSYTSYSTHPQRQHDFPFAGSPCSISPLDPSAVVEDGDDSIDEEDRGSTIRQDLNLASTVTVETTATTATVSSEQSLSPGPPPPSTPPTPLTTPPRLRPHIPCSCEQPQRTPSRHQRKRWAHYLYQTRSVKNPLTNTEIEGDPTFFAVLEPNQGGWWYEPKAMASFPTMPSKAAERGKAADKTAVTRAVAATGDEGGSSASPATSAPPGEMHRGCVYQYRGPGLTTSGATQESAKGVDAPTTEDHGKQQQQQLSPQQRLEKEAQRERWLQLRITNLEIEALHELDWRRWQRSLVVTQHPPEQQQQQQQQSEVVDTAPVSAATVQGSQTHRRRHSQLPPQIPPSSDSSSDEDCYHHHRHHHRRQQQQRHRSPSPEPYRRGIRIQMGKDLVVLDPSEHGLRLPTRRKRSSHISSNDNNTKNVYPVDASPQQRSDIQASARLDPAEVESILTHQPQNQLWNKATVTTNVCSLVPYHHDQAALDAANLAWWDPTPQPFKMPNPKLSPYAISTLPEPVARAFGGQSMYAAHVTTTSKDDSGKAIPAGVSGAPSVEQRSIDVKATDQNEAASSNDSTQEQPRQQQQQPEQQQQDRLNHPRPNTDGCTWIPVPSDDRIAVMIGTSQDFLLFPSFQRLLFRHLSQEDYEDKAGRVTVVPPVVLPESERGSENGRSHSRQRSEARRRSSRLVRGRWRRGVREHQQRQQRQQRQQQQQQQRQQQRQQLLEARLERSPRWTADRHHHHHHRDQGGVASTSYQASSISTATSIGMMMVAAADEKHPMHWSHDEDDNGSAFHASAAKKHAWGDCHARDEEMWHGHVYDGVPGFQREDYDSSAFSYGSSSDYSSPDEKDSDDDDDDDDDDEGGDNNNNETNSDDMDNESDSDAESRQRRRRRRRERQRQRQQQQLQRQSHRSRQHHRSRRSSHEGPSSLLCGISIGWRFPWPLLRWPFRSQQQQQQQQSSLATSDMTLASPPPATATTSTSNSTSARTLIAPATPQRHRRTGFEAGPDQDRERARIQRVLARSQARRQQMEAEQQQQQHAASITGTAGGGVVVTIPATPSTPSTSTPPTTPPTTPPMTSFLIMTADDRQVIHWQGLARMLRFYLTVSCALAIMAAIVYGAVRAESGRPTHTGMGTTVGVRPGSNDNDNSHRGHMVVDIPPAVLSPERGGEEGREAEEDIMDGEQEEIDEEGNDEEEEEVVVEDDDLPGSFGFTVEEIEALNAARRKAMWPPSSSSSSSSLPSGERMNPSMMTDSPRARMGLGMGIGQVGRFEAGSGLVRPRQASLGLGREGDDYHRRVKDEEEEEEIGTRPKVEDDLQRQQQKHLEAGRSWW